MKADLGNNKDFLAGLLLLVIGAVAFYMALDYPFGTTLRMGPGYFPRVLAVILMLFGIYVLVRGLKTGEKVQGRWGFRPLTFLCLSLVVFGWTMDRFGVIPALVLLFLITARAGHRYRIKQVLLMTVAMTAFAVAVFIYGLGLPYPLVEGF